MWRHSRENLSITADHSRGTMPVIFHGEPLRIPEPDVRGETHGRIPRSLPTITWHYTCHLTHHVDRSLSLTLMHPRISRSLPTIHVVLPLSSLHLMHHVGSPRGSYCGSLLARSCFTCEELRSPVARGTGRAVFKMRYLVWSWYRMIRMLHHKFYLILI